MSELEQLGQIVDRSQRLERLKLHVQSHPADAAGWYMLHVEHSHAGNEDAAAVARIRALGLDPGVAQRFTERPAAPSNTGALDAQSVVPGYRIIGTIHRSERHKILDAIEESSGAKVNLRMLRGHNHDAAERILRRQVLPVGLPGCVRARAVTRSAAGEPVQVLDLISGTALHVDEERPMAAAAAARLVSQLAEVLATLHEHAYLVGDLRPDVVFVDTAAGPCVVGASAPEGERTWTFALDADRFAWFAPEEGGDVIDRKIDIYGLGMLLWYMITGRTPPSLGERLKQPLPATGDAQIDAVIARCTAVAPATRFADARELAAALRPGRRVGPWLLGDKLGEGSYGEVYRARRTTDGQQAALKLFHAELGRPAIEAFHREVRAVAKVTAPGLLRLVDASWNDDAKEQYIATELVEGETLRELLDRGRLDAARACSIVRQLAAATDALHAAGVVHRDIKPENVLVASDVSGDITKLGDYGCAKLRGEPGGTGDGKTLKGQLIGTPEYMSPEQWDAATDLDERCDIYALGLTWFWCLGGLHPFTAASIGQWRKAHCEGARSKPPLLPGVPPHWAALVERMIAIDRAQRPATMTEVIAELERTPRAEPTEPEPPRATPAIPGPKSRSPSEREPIAMHPARRAIIGAAIAAAGIGAVYLVWLRGSPPGTSLQPDDASPQPHATPQPSLVTPVVDRALTPIRASDLPPGLESHGEIEAAYRFKDRNGLNYLVFSSEDPTTQLHVIHVDLHAPAVSRGALRQVTDKIEQCDHVLRPIYVADALGLTDLDGDGIGEVSFAYHLGCSGRDPVLVKLLLLEGPDKYILRGELMRQTGEADPATWPAGFLEHAQRLWPVAAR
jgi:serine/threonine protein kinase